MKTKTKILCLITLSFFLLWGYIYTDSNGGLKFFINYHRISIGDSKDRVVELLGAPHTMSDKFYLGQKEGYESDYVAANSSDSVKYLVWYKNISVVYSIGFDSHNRVTFKAHGGT